MTTKAQIQQLKPGTLITLETPHGKKSGYFDNYTNTHFTILNNSHGTLTYAYAETKLLSIANNDCGCKRKRKR